MANASGVNVMESSARVTTEPESMPRWLRGFGFDTAGCLLLVFLYVWLVIDPRLTHHSLGILSYYYPFSFHTGCAFLVEHLARPAGLAEYAMRLLTQFYAFGWVGALIVTVVAWSLCWSTDAMGRLAGRLRGRVLRYVPCVLLVVMYGSYSHPLGAVLSLQASLIGFVLYVRWAPQRLWQRLAILLLACAILHHLAGSGSVVFPALVAIYELLVARRPALAAAAIVFGLAVPSVSAALFAVDLREAYGGFLVSDPGMLPGKWPLTLALYVFFPAMLAGSLLAQTLLRARKTPPRAVRGSPDPARGMTDMSHKSRRPAVGGFGEVGRPAPSAAHRSQEPGKPAPHPHDDLPPPRLRWFCWAAAWPPGCRWTRSPGPCWRSTINPKVSDGRRRWPQPTGCRPGSMTSAATGTSCWRCIIRGGWATRCSAILSGLAWTCSEHRTKPRTRGATIRKAGCSWKWDTSIKRKSAPARPWKSVATCRPCWRN